MTTGRINQVTMVQKRTDQPCTETPPVREIMFQAEIRPPHTMHYMIVQGVLE